MKFVCISAANIEVARNHSASVRTCQLAGAILQAACPGAEVEIVPLLDYDLKPCRMCGQCIDQLLCPRDPAFNQVFQKMQSAQGLLVVVPHYAPLPSKLMMLLEKMEEMAYLGWCADEHNFRFPLSGRPIAVIGHGGQPDGEVTGYYQKALVEPVASAFASCSLRVVSAGESAPHGVSFGIQSLTKPAGSLFVTISHDWEVIRERITPLVKNLAAAAV